jgi:hypothetical protein
MRWRLLPTSLGSTPEGQLTDQNLFQNRTESGGQLERWARRAGRALLRSRSSQTIGGWRVAATVTPGNDTGSPAKRSGRRVKLRVRLIREVEALHQLAAPIC